MAVHMRHTLMLQAQTCRIHFSKYLKLVMKVLSSLDQCIVQLSLLKRPGKNALDYSYNVSEQFKLCPQ